MRAPPLLLLPLLAVVACGPAPKKLIEFGWDEPDTAFMRRHVEQMERAPFDGCVYRVEYEGSDGTRGRFSWEAWGRRRFRTEELRAARADLRATRFRRFRHNLLRINVTPGDTDWFDDYTAVLANARLAAELAREGESAGVLLDTETYQTPLFQYASRPRAGELDFDVYARQARRRGVEVVRALEDGFPGLTVLLTFGHSLPWWEMQSGGVTLERAGYGLLAPFVDGLIEGARLARVVDGHELSYGFREPERFADAYHTMAQGLLPIVARPGRYRRHTSFGFGIWIDYDQREKGWDPGSPDRNYFTPRGLERSLRAALETADEWVWLYSEVPRWWTEQGGREALPQPYVDAVRRARRAAGLDP